MNAIYKYELLPEGKRLKIPMGAEVLSVASQGDQIFLWALVDPREPATSEIDYLVLPTGVRFPEDDLDDFEFLDTVMMYGGTLVFHVFIERSV